LPSALASIGYELEAFLKAKTLSRQALIERLEGLEHARIELETDRILSQMIEAGEKGIRPEEARRALKALDDPEFPEQFVKNNLSNPIHIQLLFGKVY
jgi:hypothetical protein